MHYFAAREYSRCVARIARPAVYIHASDVKVKFKFYHTASRTLIDFVNPLFVIGDACICEWAREWYIKNIFQTVQLLLYGWRAEHFSRFQKVICFGRSYITVYMYKRFIKPILFRERRILQGPVEREITH